MVTRREFLEAAGTGLATMAAGGAGFSRRADLPIGVQLYTVRNLVDKDLSGTLQAIRKIGYRTVETFGAEYKMPAKDLRQAILDAGLAAPSAHFGYDDFDARLDYAKELGVEFAVCSSIPPTVANSTDGYKHAAEQFNTWAARAKAMGMRFGFHNHNAEFKVYDGKTGLDILLENTDAALVQWQMDCYWVAQAGSDPVEMLRSHGKRMQSLHVKDRKPNVPISTDTGPASAHFTEVGEGTLDWKSILSLAEKDHIPYIFVEQDQTDRPPLESLQMSYTNLTRFLQQV